MSDHDEILDRVRAAIAKTMAIDLDEVDPSKRFFTDIDAESIEWLDLSFRLDKEFGVRIPGMNFPAAETDAEGRFTPSGIAALRAFLPGPLLDRTQIRVPAPTGKELAGEITVADIADMVERALESKKALASP
jgi:acyl carrier protein